MNTKENCEKVKTPLLLTSSMTAPNLVVETNLSKKMKHESGSKMLNCLIRSCQIHQGINQGINHLISFYYYLMLPFLWKQQPCPAGTKIANIGLSTESPYTIVYLPAILGPGYMAHIATRPEG